MIYVKGYTILEKLYQGTQFTVYRALRLSDQQKVILKMCSSDHPAIQDFFILQYEYKILKSLNIPGVIGVYALEKSYNQMILVLEDIQGMTLSQFLDKKPLPLSLFFKIAISLVDTLGELHLKDIIHKDINPNNILIEPKKNIVKIIDFSISSLMSQERQDAVAATDLEGTAAYLSPEQTGRTNHSIDHRVDFYSLGITFFEMLTGQLPFHATDLLELMHGHLALIPERVNKINPNIPKVVADIVAKLLAKAPEERYISAVGLKADLLRCQQQWDQYQNIQAFEIGLEDVPDHFIISEKLYGREKQIEMLLTTYDRVSRGKAEVLWISGYSGIGKTSLVKEIYKPITRSKGYFVGGKFDQLQHGEPYFAFIEAFQTLIHRLFSEPEHRLIKIKELLLNALGHNGQIIVDVIPEISLIIGPQEPLPALSPAETHNRFVATFQNFVCVLATPENPLVIFLDDLQWIDSASLELIYSLLKEKELSHFLFIGAYRENEVSGEHPLMLLQKKLDAAQVPMQHVLLSALQLTDVSHLLADSLSSNVNKVKQLAELILSKTLGNPFFIKEFLQQLADEKLLTFSYQAHQWLWNIEDIQQLSITENVVDLVIIRIQKLCDKTQRILELAACIGHNFGLKTLCIISNQSLKEAAKAILEATHAIFITPIEGNTRILESMMNDMDLNILENEEYRFTHDRIQQAAYHLIPESEKQKLHLQIGRLLLKEKKLIDLNEELFSILNHFNVSLSLITDPHEKEMLAEYNFLAGEKAKGSSAYEAAKEYFRAALRLLESNKDHPLLFKIEKEIATMEFLTGELGAAEEGFRNLLKSDKPLLDLMEIYRLYCEMLSTNNRHQEALQLGLQALRKNYIFIPANPSMLHILWNVFSINRTDIKNHALNPMKSAEYRASLNLISQLTNSAYIIDQKLFVYLTCTSVRLSLKHGYTESGTFSYLIYTFFIMNALNLYEKALDFVHLYEKIKAKEPMPKYNARNYFVLGCMINPWRVPFAQCLEDLIKSYYFGRDTGDLLYCNYSNIYIVLTNFMAGTPLVDVDKTAHNSINFIDKNMIMDLRGFSYFVVEMLDMLTKNAFQHAVITDREQKVIASKNNSERAMFYSQVIKLCFFMNEYSLAIHYWKKFSEYQKFVLGMIVNVEATFYYLLSCIALKRNFVLSRKFLKLFKRWMEWCPDNFQSYALLLKAEQARIKHEIPLALKCYSDALISAEKQNALHVVGLINEHMGQFFLDLELYKDAKLHLLDAYYAYQNWGAMTKCALLKNQYPQYLDSFVSATTKTTSVKTVTTGLESIDILSLFKSAQMISSEMQLDKLLEKLLVLLLQSAGAERGALLTEENKHWYVQAEGTVILQLITLENKTNVETRSDLPHSLLRYVERTEEPLVLHNLTELEPYLAGDAYLSQIKPLSILVMPIMYKGTLRYLLYLENRTMHNAFTHQHIKILQLLSSQAAISIENAKLYYQATHDPLTRLANRTFLYQVFNMAIEKNKKLMIALLFFDLDGFKAINDTYGHEIGDELLLHVAKILKEEITIENLAARLGGDEFVVLLINTTLEQVVAISENLTHQLKQNVTIRNHVVQSSASIGISLYPEDATTISELLKQADIALYRVKASGKGHFLFYAREKETII